MNTNTFIGFYGRRSSHLTENHKNLLHHMLPTFAIDNKQDNLLSFFNNIASKYNNINLEIGFGSGTFLFNKVINNSNSFFIGAEVFINGVVNLLNQLFIYNKPINNLAIYNNNVYLLFNQIPANFLQNIFILFPDPWPKLKHNKRRIINFNNLELFLHILKPQGRLIFVSDHADYVKWTLDILLNTHLKNKWYWDYTKLHNIKDYSITKYFQKAIQQQHAISCLEFVKI